MSVKLIQLCLYSWADLMVPLYQRAKPGKKHLQTLTKN